MLKDMSLKIGLRLSGLRCLHRMSQETAAPIMRVSLQKYQQYERGEDDLPLESAWIFCQHLGISMDFLCNNQISPTPIGDSQ